MLWPVFRHDAMATAFEVTLAGPDAPYAGQAAAAAFRELDRLEAELSRFAEASDIARANRLARGATAAIGDDALQCLLVAARISAATGGAFDPAYASAPTSDGVVFALDPVNHTLTSLTERLSLDLGAVGKGYALDRMGEILREWEVDAACLQSGGSTVLALKAPPGSSGWTVSVAGRPFPLADRAVSASGLAVQGPHLIDPRRRAPAARDGRVWSFAREAAVADALSTAFFVLADADVAAFCAAHPEFGAVLGGDSRAAAWHGVSAPA